MMFPRAMNNMEKEGLKIVKKSGLAYEIKFCPSKYNGGFTVNVPVLCGTYILHQPGPFEKACKAFKEKEIDC